LNRSVHEFDLVDPLSELKRMLIDFASLHADMEFVPDLPFVGGLVGYLGYGASSYFDGIPKQESDPLDVPDLFFGLYDACVVFDHQQRRLHVISHRSPAHADSLKEQLFAGGELPALRLQSSAMDLENVYAGVQSSFEQAKFIETVGQCQQYIRDGQVFQIVLSQRFSLPASCQPLACYRMLQALNPSPYAYILKFPNFSYLGSSPETLVSCHESRVVLKALAGTRQRGLDDEEDARLCNELKKSEKELAEHMMLVDLGRNDLGRICEPGSVTVGELAQITKYSHVMHLATEIQGKLKAELTSFDAVRSCFPRGTVSGAPKIRAMQLLFRLEPEQRGIYSGLVGYFDLRGGSDTAIAIRSALFKNEVAHVNAGAGIVYDSEPEAEFEETRNKAAAVIKAIKFAQKVL
jgi:anthranilate synthase component 1